MHGASIGHEQERELSTLGALSFAEGLVAARPHGHGLLGKRVYD